MSEENQEVQAPAEPNTAILEGTPEALVSEKALASEGWVETSVTLTPNTEEIETPVGSTSESAEVLGSVSEFVASVEEVKSSPKYEFANHSFEILALSSDGFHLAKREDGVECEVKLEDDKIVKIRYS